MRKFIIIIALLLLSCNKDKNKKYIEESTSIYTFEYEGHEYLAKDNETAYEYYVTTFTHKGGCKACKK